MAFRISRDSARAADRSGAQPAAMIQDCPFGVGQVAGSAQMIAVMLRPGFGVHIKMLF
jgi:hypothetical protein